MTDRERLLKALTLCDGVSENYIKANDVRKVINAVFPEPKPEHVDGEQKWAPKVGSIVAHRETGSLHVVTLVGVDSVQCKCKNGESWAYVTKYMRPATPAEIAEYYTVTSVDGKYRARFYRDQHEDIRVVYSSKRLCIPTGGELDATLHYFNLMPDSPLIMPFAQSKGKYDAPTEVK